MITYLLIAFAAIAPVSALETEVVARYEVHYGTAPEKLDRILAGSHNRRQGDILSYAARKNSASVDIHQAFLDDGRAVEDVLVSSDGVHPTTAGYELMRDTFWNSAFLDGTTE